MHSAYHSHARGLRIFAQQALYGDNDAALPFDALVQE